MGISIYYTAQRAQAITPAEQAAIAQIIAQYAVEAAIEDYIHTGRGLNWESFSLYDELPAGTILEGATKLPDNTRDALRLGLAHWCAALSAIRRHVPEAEWTVCVEDQVIPWDDDQQRYDPTQL